MDYTLNDRYLKDEGTVYLTGVQALVRVRRVERQLAAEYRDSVAGALARLRPENAGLVARIAELPDMIRGYEQIKLDSVARYRTEMGTLQAKLAQAPAAAGRAG